jgi:hypothetical protein
MAAYVLQSKFKVLQIVEQTSMRANTSKATINQKEQRQGKQAMATAAATSKAPKANKMMTARKRNVRAPPEDRLHGKASLPAYRYREREYGIVNSEYNAATSSDDWVRLFERPLFTFCRPLCISNSYDRRFFEFKIYSKIDYY